MGPFSAIKRFFTRAPKESASEPAPAAPPPVSRAPIVAEILERRLARKTPPSE